MDVTGAVEALIEALRPDLIALLDDGYRDPPAEEAIAWTITDVVHHTDTVASVAVTVEISAFTYPIALPADYDAVVTTVFARVDLGAEPPVITAAIGESDFPTWIQNAAVSEPGPPPATPDP